MYSLQVLNHYNNDILGVSRTIGFEGNEEIWIISSRLRKLDWDDSVGCISLTVDGNKYLLPKGSFSN